MDAQPGRVRTPAAVTLVISLTMVAVAAVLVGPVVSQLPGGGAQRSGTPWWLLVPLFALAEMFVVHLRVRRSALTVSFGHVPLVIGLALLPPREFVLAGVIGSVFTLVLYRRQRALKLLFNTALFGCSMATATVLYHLLVGQGEPSGVRSLLAAYLTMVITDQLTALMVILVVALHEGRIARGALVEAVTWGLAVAVSNTSVGLLVVVLLERQPAAVPLVVVIVTVLLVAYRAYGQLGIAHARLEQYHGFAQSISRAHGTDSVVARILEGARELMQAESAELYLDGLEYRLDGTRPAHRQQRQWLGRVRDGAVVIKQSEDRDDLVLLGGVSQAAAAPVRFGGGTGILVVTEPMGAVGSFSADHLRSLETLAHQAGIALENGALVDRLRQEAAEREHEALHDGLTGLLNRRGFVARTDSVLGREPIAAVLLLNIDRFKDINDALGHSFGDEVLAELAARLRLVRPGTPVARLGGDEFAALLPGALPAEVAETALRMVEAVEQPIRIRDVDLHVDASIGSALSPQDGQDAEELLRRADVAMYRAKERRTGHAEYDPALDRSGAERLALYSDLRHAVRDGMLQVHLQPLIEPATGRVCGAEALARWQHPVRGNIPPDQFIAAGRAQRPDPPADHADPRPVPGGAGRPARPRPAGPGLGEHLGPDAARPGAARAGDQRAGRRRPARLRAHPRDDRDVDDGRPRAGDDDPAHAWTSSASGSRSTTSAPATPRWPTWPGCRWTR